MQEEIIEHKQTTLESIIEYSGDTLKEKLDSIDNQVFFNYKERYSEAMGGVYVGQWYKGKEIDSGMKGEGGSYRQLEKETNRNHGDLKKWHDLYEKYPDVDVFIEKYVKPQVEKVTQKWLTGMQKGYLPSFKEFEPKVYDVWNFSECDNRFGVEHPGRIPGQIIQNILYYYTKENDIILDPMAGGGVTQDVCETMNRKCYSYDINPKRDFIKKHDITNGFPDDIKNISLVILDPPYYKKKEQEYGKNSISFLNREQYLKSIEKIAKNCKGNKIALIMGKYYNYNNPNDSIFISDYINIFKKNGYKQIDEISINQTPPQGGQYAVKYAKEKQRMEIIKRDLVIFDWEGIKDGR